ncbi:hypothetical protein ES705_16611 [subsurface metagenome]
MRPKHTVCLLALLLMAVFVSNGFADVEWNIQKTLKTATPPVDIVVSADGKRIFVLSETGEILIYAPDGELQDKIGVGKHIDQIEVGPQEDMLLLKSRSNQTIDILVIDFIQKIDTANSPFKGPADAPVVIAVFSDFQ